MSIISNNKQITNNKTVIVFYFYLHSFIYLFIFITVKLSKNAVIVHVHHSRIKRPRQFVISPIMLDTRGPFSFEFLFVYGSEYVSTMKR